MCVCMCVCVCKYNVQKRTFYLQCWDILFKVTRLFSLYLDDKKCNDSVFSC